MKISYYWAKLKCKLSGNNYEIINDYYRRFGAVIGKNALICTNISGPEAFLIEIGSNTTVSVDVTFVTHDYSIHNVSSDMINLFGRIIIGNNCFIGDRAIIMYGVTLADNIIVAAGSVVTQSFNESNIIIGGNPAKIIGTWDKLYEKSKHKSLGRTNLKEEIMMHPEKLVKRKIKNV